MIKINLTKEHKSELKYKIYPFPDSQKQVKIDLLDPSNYLHLIAIKNEGVTIISRISSWDDLQVICCAVASLKNLEAKKIELHIKYMLGARSDRKFEEGTNNYLKEVICPIINQLELDKVVVLKPHSDVLEACLNNFDKIDISETLVSKILLDNDFNLSDTKIISPDAGTFKWVNSIGSNLGIEIIQCYKERELSTGKIISTKFIGDVKDKNCIIVDDLCDNGGSFIGIAKYLKEQGAKSIYLAITHSILSKGFGELQQYFDAIYTTNSYKDFEPDTNQFIKQLDVF